MSNEILHLSLGASRLDKNSEISNFMWYFMKEYGESCDKTNITTHEERSSNCQTISEIVCAISHQIQVC